MSSSPQDPRRGSGARLSRLLREAGWEQVGGRAGLFDRYQVPEGPAREAARSLLVPLDQNAADFPELWQEALNLLRLVPDGSFVQRLAAAPTDQYRFERETEAPPGWIKYDAGMDLHASLRQFLATSAKTARQRLKYFGNRHWNVANQFLDEVMMGQTAVGSYVVRAYVPIAAEVLTNAAVKDQTEFGPITGRDVTRLSVRMLSEAQEAIDYYRTSESLTLFTDPSSSLSYEAVKALQTLASGGLDSEVQVSMEAEHGDGSDRSWTFEFAPSVVPILERAATQLAEPEKPTPVKAVGLVHLLTRAQGAGPGVVGLTTRDGKPANKLRVRLSGDDYHLALAAHDTGQEIEVSGLMEREGNLNWLLNASISQVLREAQADVGRDVPQGGLF